MSGLGNILEAGGGGIIGTGLGLLTNNALQKQNFKWSQKAAEAEWARQMQLYERQYHDKSPLNVVNQLREAGLNKNMMFSGGAGNVGGAASGSKAPSTQQFQTQKIDSGMNLALMGAQIENIKADTQEKLSRVPYTGAKTQTENDIRQYTVEERKQAGKQIFLNNLEKQWKFNPADFGDVATVKNEKYGEVSISNVGAMAKETYTNIANKIADTDMKAAQELLTNNRANGYLQELANETTKAEAAKKASDNGALQAANGAIQAAATKLAAEFNYGEYTNWKYWIQLSSEVVNTAGNVVGKVRKPDIIKNTYNTNNKYEVYDPYRD